MEVCSTSRVLTRRWNNPERTSGMLLMSYTGPTLDWLNPIPILTNSMPSRMHWSSGATMALNVTACIPGPHDGTQKMNEHEWKWHWPPGMDQPMPPCSAQLQGTLWLLIHLKAPFHQCLKDPETGDTWSGQSRPEGQPHFSWPWNFVEITASAMMDRPQWHWIPVLAKHFCQGSPRTFAISQVLRSCLSADVFLRSWTSKLQHINCGRIATSNLIYSFDSMNPSMWRNNMVQLLIEATAPIKFWVKE